MTEEYAMLRFQAYPMEYDLTCRACCVMAVVDLPVTKDSVGHAFVMGVVAAEHGDPTLCALHTAMKGVFAPRETEHARRTAEKRS